MSTAGMSGKIGTEGAICTASWRLALRKRDLRLVAPFHIIRGFNWFLAGWNQWEQSFDEAAVERGMAEGWDLFDPEYR